MAQQWTITHGRWSARVLEAGGGLAALEYDGRQLLDPVVGEPVTGGHGQILIPWPNRIRDGAYTYDGAKQLAITEPKFHNASHGLVRWGWWAVAEQADDSITLVHRVMPQSGYPWELHVSATYSLDEQELTVRLSATNASRSTVPFAAGMHPYLSAGTKVDGTRLTLPATRRLSVDDRRLPQELVPAEGEYDFTGGRVIGQTVLDDPYTGLQRDSEGNATVRLEGEHTVELVLGPEWRWVQVFTGDTLAEGARQALAVEPMTSPPDAFNSHTDLCELDPRETWTGSYRITTPDI